MDLNIGLNPLPLKALGSYGEFSVGDPSSPTKAVYFLTRVKPGTKSWEGDLANRMVPWREIFNVEEVSFDELVQRDLDDSRVSQDLIPYLLDKNNDQARFFPPILAIVVPRTDDKKGIREYYPEFTVNDAENFKFNCKNLFEFKSFTSGENLLPFAELNYATQETGFVIVDGQHRAMAVLALHRQISGWGENTKFSSYYSHLNITKQDISHIELPVCILFFPELSNVNENVLKDQGISLRTVCREIFIAVNKNAKPVSKARELLLDDEDIAARLMRKTLSKLKNRDDSNYSQARIYSFSYGDDEGEGRKKAVVRGLPEYCTATLLHKLHRASSFGSQEFYSWDTKSNAADLRSSQSSSRPAELLVGTKFQSLGNISCFSGKNRSAEEIDGIVKELGEINDVIILKLFDEFKPFALQNHAMREIRNDLSTPEARGEIINQQCYNLLFEGSGSRAVFEEHIRKLEDYTRNELPHDDIKKQLERAKAVSSSYEIQLSKLKKLRACYLYSINSEKFFSSAEPESQELLIAKSNHVYETISTQAFQLGYMMSILTVVQDLIDGMPTYEERLKLVTFITELFINCMNAYFSPKDTSLRESWKGYVTEPRSNVFDGNELGLRGLLRMSTTELNEKYWDFFKYSILEIVHSEYAAKALAATLSNTSMKEQAKLYVDNLPRFLEKIASYRADYIEKAQLHKEQSSDFKQQIALERATQLGAGQSDEAIEKAITDITSAALESAKNQALANIKASVGNDLEWSQLLKLVSANLQPA